jgi:hypothetical protein
MKRSEIKVGVAYTDGKGSIREVIAEGPQYTLYNSQEETDNLRYLLVCKKRGPLTAGQEYNCTRAAFANWAKGISWKVK